MKEWFYNIDWLLIVPVMLLTMTGLITLISFYTNNIPAITQMLIAKHIFSILLGIMIALVISSIDYRVLPSLMQVLFFIIIFFLILVLFIGDPINGAQSWLSIGPLNIQPSEFAKIIVLIITAQYFTRYHHKLYSIWTIIISLLPIILIIVLTLLQPDFGTAFIIGSLWIGMVLFGGVKLQHIVIFFSIGLGLIFSVWMWFLESYQKQRIFTFLDPNSDPLGSGYNTLQVIKSVSSGGLQGRMVQVISVPEIETDFIFAGFAQQWGFVGVSIYFILILLIIGRIIYIGLQSQDRFSHMIVLGVILCILIQTIINIGMNIGLLPITGIPLPFMSYGGSSMLTSWILIGLILSVKKHQIAKGTIFMKNTGDIFG